MGRSRRPSSGGSTLNPSDLRFASIVQSVTGRTLLPLVTTPKIGGKRTTGLGDSTLLLAPTHKIPFEKQGEFLTVGPVLGMTIPTATQNETGSKKFSLGPGALVLRNFTDVSTKGDSLLVGVLGYQIWSVAGNSNRAGVSKLFAQPIAIYHFNTLFDQKGWYAGTPDDLWQYDWNNKEMVQIPLGARLGRVFTIGKQPINMFFQSWYNPVSSRGASANYAFKLNLTFLFPQ